MRKIIQMTRPVSDSNDPNLPLELAIHKTSYLLTDLFLGEGRPFRKAMEKKLFKEDIENRRIRFDVGGYAEYYKDLEAGRMEMKYIVTGLWLWVTLKEHRKDLSGYDVLQSMYMQVKLEEYLYEQGVVVLGKQIRKNVVRKSYKTLNGQTNVYPFNIANSLNISSILLLPILNTHPR